MGKAKNKHSRNTSESSQYTLYYNNFIKDPDSANAFLNADSIYTLNEEGVSCPHLKERGSLIERIGQKDLIKFKDAVCLTKMKNEFSEEFEQICDDLIFLYYIPNGCPEDCLYLLSYKINIVMKKVASNFYKNNRCCPFPKELRKYLSKQVCLRPKDVNTCFLCAYEFFCPMS